MKHSSEFSKTNVYIYINLTYDPNFFVAWTVSSSSILHYSTDLIYKIEAKTAGAGAGTGAGADTESTKQRIK